MNRKYEVLAILRPNLKDNEVGQLIERYKKVVTDNGGTISKAEVWEKRKLAYEINNHKDGIYVIMNFESAATLPLELARQLRISDDVVRHTIVKDAGFEPNVIQAPTEGAAA